MYIYFPVVFYQSPNPKENNQAIKKDYDVLVRFQFAPSLHFYSLFGIFIYQNLKAVKMSLAAFKDKMQFCIESHSFIMFFYIYTFFLSWVVNPHL